jgi:AcrR family transcriptional regulator
MSSSSSATRDRILTEAMRLFAEQGVKATSVAQVERACGLTPGAGGLFHHFRTKEAVLEAGIQRHRDRLAALRDLRRVFANLGDLRAELTVIGRYVLCELEAEGELLQIAASDGRRLPHLLTGAVDSLLGATVAELAAWLEDRVGLDAPRARRVAAVAFGTLVSRALLAAVFAMAPADDLSDDAFVDTWVELMMPQLAPPAP